MAEGAKHLDILAEKHLRDFRAQPPVLRTALLENGAKAIADFAEVMESRTKDDHLFYLGRIGL